MLIVHSLKQGPAPPPSPAGLQIVSVAGVRELHGTVRKAVEGPMAFRPAGLTLRAPAPPAGAEWQREVADARRIELLLAAARSGMRG